MKAILLTASKEKGREVFDEKSLEKIRQHFAMQSTIYTREDILSQEGDFRAVEVIFACWGVEVFSLEEIRQHLPNLKGLFYVGGSVQYFAKPFLQAGVRVCGSWQANAVAVAEYVVSQMILGIKGTFRSRIKQASEWEEKKQRVLSVKGFYGIKIGILGSGAIGKKVIELLSNYRDNQLEI